eukprot:TRINITY_DN11791_c0_g1_i1.p3 TRINITY_DN11791_c0_g1~~TRINITY_DN11791_c0_g1_i1.p3  ORF type:complete len:101 (+),score=13.55 TRINITY_DN11791_c0_g1_i1:84-386(+)
MGKAGQTCVGGQCVPSAAAHAGAVAFHAFSQWDNTCQDFTAGCGIPQQSVNGSAAGPCPQSVTTGGHTYKRVCTSTPDSTTTTWQYGPPQRHPLTNMLGK